MFKLNTIGIIKAGENTGFQVKIQDDSVNTGGFLILTSKDFSNPKAEGYDSWVANESDLKGYILESKWKIEWKS